MKTLAELTIDLKRLENGVNKTLEELPKLLGVAVVNDMKSNFTNQSTTTDAGSEKWVPSAAAMREGRKTLIKTGKLMNNISYNAGQRFVIVGIDTSVVKYGVYHNEGMPPQIKRQFITLRKSTVDRVIRETLERNVR